MDNEKWPAFMTGFVLGILVTLGVGGTFGWYKYRQARAETVEALHLAEEAAARERAHREEAEIARAAAERAKAEAQKKLEEFKGKDK